MEAAGWKLNTEGGAEPAALRAEAVLCGALQVRFKLASSYSGRVLKHVYEDGQEVDSPEEKYPHSFLHRKNPPSHLELEQLCGFQEPPSEDPPGEPSSPQHPATLG